MLPDFIGIGPARSATTWIYECLSAHPQICMAKYDKKTHYFDLYYERGSKWYEDLFSDCKDDHHKGELTETYFFYDEVPERIHRICPFVKLFSCLRHPVERAFSAYLHLLRDGAFTWRFEEALEREPKIFITDNLYYDHLKRYFDFFPKEQIYITLFEDVKQNPETYLRNMYSFLDVEPNFLPTNYNQKRNFIEQPRFPLLNKLMLHSHFVLRDLDLYKYIVPLKETKLIKRLRFKPSGNLLPVMHEDTRKRLQDMFSPQIEQLGGLIGRDVSPWLTKSEVEVGLKSDWEAALDE